MKVKAVAQVLVPVIYEVDIDEENLKELKKEYSYERRTHTERELLEPIWKINRTKSRNEVLNFLNEHLDDVFIYAYPRYIEAYPKDADRKNEDNIIFTYDN